MDRATKAVTVSMVIAVALLAAACGSKSSKPTTTAEWANGLCSAISTWKGSISSAADSIKGGDLSKSSLQTTANNVKTATSTFESSVKKLGKPPTKTGAQAQASVQQLSTQVSDGVTSIQSTVNDASGLTGILRAVPTVSATLLSMGNAVNSTYRSLQSLDPGGELTSAFSQAPACGGIVPSTG
jgi:hypothetical protein